MREPTQNLHHALPSGSMSAIALARRPALSRAARTANRPSRDSYMAWSSAQSSPPPSESLASWSTRKVRSQERGPGAWSPDNPIDFRRAHAITNPEKQGRGRAWFGLWSAVTVPGKSHPKYRARTQLGGYFRCATRACPALGVVRLRRKPRQREACTWAVRTPCATASQDITRAAPWIRQHLQQHRVPPTARVSPIPDDVAPRDVHPKLAGAQAAKFICHVTVASGSVSNAALHSERRPITLDRVADRVASGTPVRYIPATR